ncbi:vigilin-like [Homarus americanus]|uniref:vigilin-like n=1 Tax=Homarus americanus TaxID=6706 RepID=UPI001C44CE23|nr:vigilin-like [Homarus americanus]
MRAQWVEETALETVQAPNCLLGIVVGPGGSTVKKIIDQYKVQVRVPRKGSKDEPILVEGKNKTLVKEAALHIKAMIDEEKERRRVTTPVSRTLFIPKALHGKIIGHRGQNIRPIIQSLKINIVFPNKNNNNDEVIITGLPNMKLDQGIGHLLSLVTSFPMYGLRT